MIGVAVVVAVTTVAQTAVGARCALAVPEVHDPARDGIGADAGHSTAIAAGEFAVTHESR